MTLHEYKISFAFTFHVCNGDTCHVAIPVFCNYDCSMCVIRKTSRMPQLRRWKQECLGVSKLHLGYQKVHFRGHFTVDSNYGKTSLEWCLLLCTFEALSMLDFSQLLYDHSDQFLLLKCVGVLLFQLTLQVSLVSLILTEGLVYVATGCWVQV